MVGGGTASTDGYQPGRRKKRSSYSKDLGGGWGRGRERISVFWGRANFLTIAGRVN